MTPEQKRAQRMRHGSVAVFLAFLLIISGTFAWQSLTQSAINPMWDETNHGGRIHDNFDGDLINRPSHGWRNKDVYAENFGDTPLFVRIQLLEFFSQDEEPLNPNWDIDDPHGLALVDGREPWEAFRSFTNNINIRHSGSRLYEVGIQWHLGHVNEAPKYFMPTFNRATHHVYPTAIGTNVPPLFAHPNAYRMTDATGDAVEWFSYRYDQGVGLLERDEVFHARDFREQGRQSAPGLDESEHENLDPAGQHDNWSPGDTVTSQRIWTPITPRLGGVVPQPRELLVETLGSEDGYFTHAAQPTLTPGFDIFEILETTAEERAEIEAFETLANRVLGLTNVREDFTGVMTIQNWTALGRPAGNFWIHDTEDGWFYWNGFLVPGSDPHAGETTATSLLLDAIYVPAMSQSWQYVIVVDGDFFRPESLREMSLRPAALEIFELAIERGGDEAVNSSRPITPLPPGVTSPPIETEPTEPSVPAPVLNVVFNQTIADTAYDIALTWSTRLTSESPLPTEYRLYANDQYVATHIPTGTQVNPHVGGRWMEIGHLDLQDGDILTIVPVANDIALDEIGPFTFASQ